VSLSKYFRYKLETLFGESHKTCQKTCLGYVSPQNKNTFFSPFVKYNIQCIQKFRRLQFVLFCFTTKWQYKNQIYDKKKLKCEKNTFWMLCTIDLGLKFVRICFREKQFGFHTLHMDETLSYRTQYNRFFCCPLPSLTHALVNCWSPWQ